MGKQHYYRCNIVWTGNTGAGTSSYKAYKRDHQVIIEGKPVLEGSADSAFMGDPSKYNPEDMFLSSLSTCHMLWYLHLCSDAGIIVVAYRDETTGTLEESAEGGRFTTVCLHPQVTITDSSRIEEANRLHEAANKQCFIANSCNFPIDCDPVCTSE